MGILANRTPQFSPGSEPKALTRSLLYCAGTEADPLRHEQEDSRESVMQQLQWKPEPVEKEPVEDPKPKDP